MIVKGIDERKAASTILIFGIIQWILIVLLAEGIQPEYISSIHYVSSLRTGKTASIYNTSTILLGACVAIVSLLIRQFNSSRIFFVLFLIAGLATIGVGVFPEDSRLMHGIVTPVALIFGALAALLSYKIQDRPASYFSVVLGAVSLISGIIFIPYLGLSVDSRAVYLGLFKGTLERLVIYTNLLWVLILGSQLSNSTSE